MYTKTSAITMSKEEVKNEMTDVKKVTDVTDVKEELKYTPSCFHCNPNRKVYPHPTKALQNVQNPTLDFVHLQPQFQQRRHRRDKKNTIICQKSFVKPTQSACLGDGTTPTPTRDVLYSKQKSFMYKFNVNILDKNSILKFHSIMKEFMIELSYDPNDKSDVVLFYTQEDMEELYNVYRLRCKFGNDKFTFYEHACDNIHLIVKPPPPTIDETYLIVKLQKMKI